MNPTNCYLTPPHPSSPARKLQGPSSSRVVNLQPLLSFEFYAHTIIISAVYRPLGITALVFVFEGGGGGRGRGDHLGREDGLADGEGVQRVVLLDVVHGMEEDGEGEEGEEGEDECEGPAVVHGHDGVVGVGSMMGGGWGGRERKERKKKAFFFLILLSHAGISNGSKESKHLPFMDIFVLVHVFSLFSAEMHQ